MTRLIFISLRSDPSPETLDSILRQSRANNERDGVTGVLISSDHHFMQVLEGEAASVKRCFQRIVRDARHSDVQIVSCREASERLFPGAGMFAVDASEVRGTGLGGYLADRELRADQVPSAAVEEMCGRLAREHGFTAVAQRLPGDATVAPRRRPDERTERLRRIRWSAWNVIGANLRAGSLEGWKLEQLRNSVARQTAEVQALRLDLRGADADPELHVEVEELCSFLAEAAQEIARQLGARSAN